MSPAEAVPTRNVPGHWIAGELVPSISDRTISVEDPSTEECVAEVPAGDELDVTRAVAAARAALPGWSDTAPKRRAELVRAVAAELAACQDELVEVITTEVGSPVAATRQAQVGLALTLTESCVDIAAEFEFERTVRNSVVLREPAGVVGAITPWNVPLLLTLQKVVPAWLAGCTVVHKPSELTPLNAFVLARATAAAGLPPGVFNVVVGTGPVAGAALARSPGVDLVSFTGSTRAGREIAAAAAADVKRVHLELGGKNASVVLPDADLATAVAATIDQACFNTGQTCLQWSRLLVPADRHDEAVELAVAFAERYRVGDPRDPATDLGPLASAAARHRVLGHIAKGVEEGAVLATGGTGTVGLPERGHWVRPAVFGRVDSSMALAQEEIFGPVVAVLPYTDEDDAARIVDDTRYGLHGSVWSADDGHAMAFAARLRTGQVDINGGPFNVWAPFGGMKHSGLGRECGLEGLDAFCEIKSIQLPTSSTGPVGPRLHV
jgi:aldehyde dehydrogenase (NAD+)/betaine-aldehyde dehydrogenase